VLVPADRGEAPDDLLAWCQRLTPAVERIAPNCALLDLGQRSEHDALGALDDLIQQIGRLGCQAQVGLAPSLTLAQLAAFRASAAQPLVQVTATTAAAVLRETPVSVLPQLHPQGTVSATLVERLQRYGLRTLGHLMRLREPALRRQFGEIGGFLACVACGQDAQPLRPTPPPDRLGMRVRLPPGAPAEQAVAMLDPLGQHLARRLRQQGRQSRRLHVRVRWECGCARQVGHSLRGPSADAVVLARELRRLLLPLLHAQHEEVHPPTLEELRVTLEDFTPISPEQAALWRTTAHHQDAVQGIAEALARRHARPLLLQAQPTNPAAIFTEERHHLAALGAAAAAPANAPERALSRGASPAEPWQAVPQRLHWW
jgi:nucleotidyltransferase/DNA polymerase involved in DNA repair